MSVFGGIWFVCAALLSIGGMIARPQVRESIPGYIAEALRKAGSVQVKAADLLGMSFRSFRYYVKKYNLRRH